jgi:hypothetical protein
MLPTDTFSAFAPGSYGPACVRLVGFDPMPLRDNADAYFVSESIPACLGCLVLSVEVS